METINFRRDLHMHPELGFMEFRTASIVAETLQLYGFDTKYGSEVMDKESRQGVPSKNEIDKAYKRALNNGANPKIIEKMEGGLTAVIGTLSGNKPGPTIAFRFDMDALPILESSNETHFPFVNQFRSKYEGAMHACGHDGHTAIGLSLAKEMSKQNFAGTLMLIFQPAEEGGRGAASLVAKGVLDNIDKLYCMHLGLGISEGEVCGGSTGWLATTKLKAIFHGTSAHSGMSPEKGKNALMGAATALLNIQGIPRYSDGITRINVGKLSGGTAANIIPDKSSMTIETRSDKAYINQELEENVKKIIKHSAFMHGLDYEIEVIGEGTTIQCDESLVKTVTEEATSMNTFTSIKYIGTISGSEDASLLIKRVQECGGQGTYMIIGMDLPAPHHNSEFDIGEKNLDQTVELLYKIAKKELH